MSNNLKFWLISTTIFSISSFVWFLIGLFTAGRTSINFLHIQPADKADLGLMNLLIVYIGLIGGISGGLFGFLLAFIFVRRLGKKWGGRLNFGNHPVLKLTSLAFITALIIVFLILLFFPIPEPN